MVCLVHCTHAPAPTSKDFERVKQSAYSKVASMVATPERVVAIGTAYRTTRSIRVTTVLGVVVRAMSNGGYLLFKESSRLQAEECQRYPKTL
ncbi:hypothetical protein MiSe_29030 [Microseira wollei NIES-4236]|uniref:Uncharacterized protein n=1 Tax=Microseira wollei NIES-4236 TaxID=2530354 RepID=A0AAV3X7K9_9CYAN|nr:hypothetical protein MiSe_29030 [Microseira wollei NIES-4236]